MNSPAQVKVVLEGKKAIDLWLSGKDKWNAWAEENPLADVSFRDADFSNFLNENTNCISFKEYIFPHGKTHFLGAKFGDGKVDFQKANFGNGDVRFTAVDFGDGEVDFSDSIFGDGNVDFSDTIFGDGDSCFCGIKFGDGSVEFTRAQFGLGEVYFGFSKFGIGHVYFNYVTFDKGNVSFEDVTFDSGQVTFGSTDFGHGDVCFSGVEFGDGGVDFASAKFGEGDVNFDFAKFGTGGVGFNHTEFGSGYVFFHNTVFADGKVSFRYAKFDDGNLMFDNTEFGEGEIDFNYVVFGEGVTSFRGVEFGEGGVSFYGSQFLGHLSMSELRRLDRVNKISFERCFFGKSLDLSGNSFNCVPDLTNTKTTHHVSISNVGIHVNKMLDDGYFIRKKITVDAMDIDRVRRLKEIAENNKDHVSALQFHIQELKARRWIYTTGTELFIEFVFEKFSDFGRSEVRPVVCLLILWVLFAPLYAIAATTDQLKGNFLAALSDGLVFSFSQILLLVPSARDGRSESTKALFNEDIPNWIYAFTSAQSVMAIILVFMLGLALRNRFRI